MSFFSICSIILTILAMALFIPILAFYIETGQVLRFPTLFVCGFIGLAALQSLFTGLILSNLALKNRRGFEYRLAQIARKIK